MIDVNFVKKVPTDLVDVKLSCETPKPNAPPSDPLAARLDGDPKDKVKKPKPRRGDVVGTEPLFSSDTESTLAS